MSLHPVLLTARNDGLIDSFKPVQLSAWRANVDMQYCVSHRKVIEYCTKYATKISATTFFTCQCSKLLGSHAFDEHQDEEQPATVASALDHYVRRPTTANFESMTLLYFVQHYSMPQGSGSEQSKRRKKVRVIVRPFCPPDPQGPEYEQYCQQKLMLHHKSELLGTNTTFTAAYAEFLQSGNIPTSLEDDIHRLQQSSQQPSEDDTEVSRSSYKYNFIHMYM